MADQHHGHHRNSGGHSQSSIEYGKLKNMILSFRVTELTMLLQYANKNKSGKKSELQQRAIEVARTAVQRSNTQIMAKIRELHTQRFSDQQVPESKHLTAQSHYQQTYGKHYSMGDQNYTSMPSLAALSGHSSRSPAVPPPADVKFKHLPFYDVIEELVKPCALLPQQQTPHSRFIETNVSFQLTVKQANEVSTSRVVVPGSQTRHNGLTSAAADYNVQIQLRFCLLETTSEQADHFPSNCCVKVNGKMCTLPQPLPTNKPGVEPKRPSRPVNITPLCKLSPVVSNNIQISWAASSANPNEWPQQPRAYAVTVHLVQKLSASDLQARIRAKGIKDADHTRAMVKEKLRQDPDSEIATMSLKGSLLCPLGKMRMTFPCRAQTCSHIQCFDGLLYLQMNEKKPAWTCPVCDRPALFNDLFVDGLFVEILEKAPAKCEQVEFYDNGSWKPLGVSSPVKVKSEPQQTVNIEVGQKRKRNDSETSTKSQPSPTKKPVEQDIITIDSDSDDDATEPPTPGASSNSNLFDQSSRTPPAAHQQPRQPAGPLVELSVDDIEDFHTRTTGSSLFQPYSQASQMPFTSWAQNSPSPLMMDFPSFLPHSHSYPYNTQSMPTSTISRAPTHSSGLSEFDVISIDD